MQLARFHIKKQKLVDKHPDLRYTSQGSTVILDTDEELILEFTWPDAHIEHTIEISLVNKISRDTWINESGEVAADLSAVVDKIEFNNFDITNYINSFGVFKTTRNQTLKTHGYMGYNGTYSFKFRYNPFYMRMMCFVSNLK